MRPPRENMLLCESITRAAKDAARWGLCHSKLMADRSDENTARKKQRRGATKQFDAP
jgi:hypothetical protein